MSNRSDIHYCMTEVRAADDGAGISGYASHFLSVDSYGTAVKRGAFRKTIKERGDKTKVLWNHNTDYVIGRPTQLREDATGLYFDARISEGTTYGRDVMALLRDGVPLDMSFGFQTIKDRSVADDDVLDFTHAPDYFKSKDGRKQVRVIEEVRLWEISVVTFGSNEYAAINDVRKRADISSLSFLLEDLRAGTLSEEDARWPLLQNLVAAFSERAEPEPSDDTPLPDENARRLTLRDIEIALALGTSQGWLTTGA